MSAEISEYPEKNTSFVKLEMDRVVRNVVNSSVLFGKLASLDRRLVCQVTGREICFGDREEILFLRDYPIEYFAMLKMIEVWRESINNNKPGTADLSFLHVLHRTADEYVNKSCPWILRFGLNRCSESLASPLDPLGRSNIRRIVIVDFLEGSVAAESIELGPLGNIRVDVFARNLRRLLSRFEGNKMSFESNPKMPDILRVRADGFQLALRCSYTGKGVIESQINYLGRDYLSGCGIRFQV
ncbi:MAG: hypothetical protein NZM26_03235 [Patescibacteria group bacterium]|nr:hypothetical protein [Patescibacteria group bacterium]